MTPDERILAGVQMQPVKWRELPTGDLPYAVMHGVLHIGDERLRCYQLSDGRRILDADDVRRLFGLSEPVCGEPR